MNMFCDWLADTKEIIVGDSFFRKLILYSCIVFRFIQPNERPNVKSRLGRVVSRLSFSL